MAVMSLLFGLISFCCELGRLTCCKGAAGGGQQLPITVHNPVVKDWSGGALPQGAAAPAFPQPWQAQQQAGAALPPGWTMQSDGTAGGTFFIAPDGSRHWQVPQPPPGMRPAY